jgi:hypothetical protein
MVSHLTHSHLLLPDQHACLTAHASPQPAANVARGNHLLLHQSRPSGSAGCQLPGASLEMSLPRIRPAGDPLARPPADDGQDLAADVMEIESRFTRRGNAIRKPILAWHCGRP